MKKYILVSSIVASLLIGCGGSSSSGDEGKIKTPNTPQTSTTNSSLPTKNGKLMFSKDYLKGKMLFRALKEDKKIKVYVFEENTFKINPKNNPQAKPINYQITQEGYLKFTSLKTGKVVFYKPLKQSKLGIAAIRSHNKEELANANEKNVFFHYKKSSALEALKSL